MDLLRLLGPNTIALFVEVLELTAMVAICARYGVFAAAVAAPLVLLAGGIVCTAVTIAMKWVLIGRYRRSVHPLWCSFVWRDELMNAAQEQLADEKLLRLTIGTPIMSLYLRAMGSKVGRGVWCETTAVTEHDMITLDDGAAVNRGALPDDAPVPRPAAADRPDAPRSGRHARPDRGRPARHPRRHRDLRARPLRRAARRGAPGRDPLARHAGDRDRERPMTPRVDTARGLDLAS